MHRTEIQSTRIYTITQLSELSGLTKKRLKKAIKDGQLAAVCSTGGKRVHHFVMGADYFEWWRLQTRENAISSSN